MKSTLTRTLLVSCLLTAIPFEIAVAQENCDDGSVWEPYTVVCAEVRDVRDEFLPGSTEQASAGEISELVPGGLAVGTTYRPNELVALESGRLHTRMFVHPDGLQPDGPMPILATPARNRVHHSAELVGMYPSNRLDAGVLGLFGWSCLPEYPCPDGRTSPGWQWFRDFSTLGCNITHTVDQGNHAQKVLYYANHTDKLDNGTPPQYQDAVYLWNYCDTAWDLVWSHVYREEKVDCSVPGAGCAWWGPSLETFGDSYPRIAELGFEDSLLYHDGVWSELRWPEAGFREPEVWATYTPWQLFHLDPNRSYGVGNFLNENDPPSIVGQIDLNTLEDEPIELNQSHLVIDDPDVDPAYHSSFELTLYGGNNYTFSGTRVIPASNFTGTLTVPVTVNDGAAESPVFDLKIDVLPAIRIEAEDMQLDTYRVEALDFASDGALINLKGPGLNGSATTTFPGMDGEYDVSVVYHDENDGLAQLTVTIAGVSIDSWILDQTIPGGAQPQDYNRFSRQIATDLTVNNGDTIRIDGLQENWDHANVDYIEFAVARPQPTDAVRVEAEAMDLDTYRIEMLDFASNGALINLKGPGLNGSATAAFPGNSGNYDVVVVYHDENDGVAQLTVTIAGVSIDSWILDQTIPGGAQPQDYNRFSRQITTDLTVNNGDTIRIDGLQENWDHANVDYIDFIVKEQQNTVQIEAEDMELDTYSIEALDFASNGALINLKGPGLNGSATAAFPGNSGNYDITVVFHDENDGVAQLTVSIAGVSVDSWLLDFRSTESQPKPANRRVREIATGYTVNNGDEIRIDGLQGNWDHANVDYIRFVLAQ